MRHRVAAMPEHGEIMASACDRRHRRSGRLYCADGSKEDLMSRRIAIVEDDPAIRENVADALRRQGYELSTYPDRQQALAAFKTRLPDLAIVDIGLGAEVDGGFTLVRELRALSETLP